MSAQINLERERAAEQVIDTAYVGARNQLMSRSRLLTNVSLCRVFPCVLDYSLFRQLLKTLLRRCMVKKHSLFAIGLIVAASLNPDLGMSPARAASLDGAGRIVVVPYVVSGFRRETTLYLTNPSRRFVTVSALYIGAEGTPFASSVKGPISCASRVTLRPEGSEQISLSQLCPELSTPDVENVGYVELTTRGGNDTAPFFATSVVNTINNDQFGVEGVPVGAIDSAESTLLRVGTLRVTGLEGDVPSANPAGLEKVASCYVATLAEPKNVTVQLMEYTSGAARPIGTPVTAKLGARQMVQLRNIFQMAGLPRGRSTNTTAEFYADHSGTLIYADGAALIASCGISTLALDTEDYRLARTPRPRDLSRTRGPVVGEMNFSVGPYTIGYGMPQGVNAVMSTYLRHEDHVRCWLVRSSIRPNVDSVPWQELRVINPDGVVVAGGPFAQDTGVFFTGVKNSTNNGINDRWRIEVSWIGTPGSYPPLPNNIPTNLFSNVQCTSSSGMSHLMPLSSPVDSF